MPKLDDVEEFDIDDSQEVESDQEDETLDEEDDGSETDDSDNDDDSDSDDDTDNDEVEGDEDEGKFEPRYTQFKGESLEDYVKKLEDAYGSSSKEGVSNARKLTALQQKVATILEAVEKSPELAKQLGLSEDDTTELKPKSTAETYAEQLMEERQEQEYSDFAKKHPEIESDEALRSDLLAEVSVQAAAYNARTGKIISMEKALTRAWKVLGYDDDSKEDLAVAGKKVAGQGKVRSGSAKTKKNKAEVSPKALEIAKKWGLSEKDFQ